MNSGLRLIKPKLPDFESVQKYFDQSKAKDWYTNYGPCYQELSRLFSDRAKNTPNLILTNATVALETVMKALFQQKSDSIAQYVLVPSYTFSATITSITNIGLKPIYVDVDLDDWHMSASHLENLLNQYQGRVVGILTCSTFGTLPPKEKLSSWRKISNAYEMKLVIDSAAGYGNDYLADYHEYEYADAVVYSMHATKPFAVGEGGIILSDQQTVDKCKMISQFGFDERRIPLPNGTNGKISEIMCAFGLAALESLEKDVRIRRDIARVYRDNLKHSTGVTFQENEKTATHQSMFIQLSDLGAKRSILEELRKNKIEFREDWGQPVHEMIKSDFVTDMDSTKILSANCLSLPIWIGLKEESIVEVCDIISQF